MQNESAMQETPYTIPKDWKWVLQEEVCSLTDGEKIEDETLPYLEVKYLRGTKEAEFVDKGKFIKNGSKVILVDGENSGEVFSVFEDGYMGSTFKQLIISKDVNEKYIQFFIDSKKQVYRNNKKGSAIPHLNKSLFFSMPLPLPPIAEQERIVGRIEKLFADLDAAKEKVQTVLEQSAERKAAILHQAFTGTLTTAWRKKNKQLVVKNEELRIETSEKPYNIPDSWIWVKGKSIFNEMESIKPTGEYFNYIDIESVDNTNQTVSAPKVIETSKAPSRASRKLHDGDTIFSMVRPYLKNIAYINEDLKDCIASTGFFIASPKEFVDSEYLFQLMKSPFVINGINSFMRGDNSPSVRKNDIEDFCYPLPTLPEQSEIVSLLDSLLGAEKTIAENCQTVLDKISDIKKAILAKAFRGLL